MRTFNDFAGLARHLDRVRSRIPEAIEAELEAQGKALRREAQALFGHYQAGWPALADSTVAERTRLGYAPNDPLLREGKLRDAITFRLEDGRDGRQLFVGVPTGIILSHPYRKGTVQAHKLMAVHEYGSTDGRVPARPVFGIVQHRITRFTDAVGAGVVARIGL